MFYRFYRTVHDYSGAPCKKASARSHRSTARLLPVCRPQVKVVEVVGYTPNYTTTVDNSANTLPNTLALNPFRNST